MTEEQLARKRATEAARRKANPEAEKARHAAYRKANPEKIKASISAYQKANPEKCRAKSSAWRKRYPERVWRKRYPEKHNASNAAWRKRNLDAHAAYQAKRRAAKLRATPTWANQDLICSFYLMAKFTGLEVDHIIPLKGRTVCGLHVEHNLQLLTAEENSRKGNKLLPEHSNPPCVFE